MITIKNKITLGFGVLFLIILLLGGAGIAFINHLASKTKGTIVDNYHSVSYTVSMIEKLEELHGYNIKFINSDTVDVLDLNLFKTASAEFGKLLTLESQNITETGEAGLVAVLQEKYRNYLSQSAEFEGKHLDKRSKSVTLDSLKGEVNNSILRIYRLNMRAILDKNENLVSTANDLTIYKIIAVLVSVIVSISFMVYFPKQIIKPFKVLTQKMQLIIEGKYHQRLENVTKDEIGVLTSAFNNMAEKLESYEAQHYDEIIFEKKRMESLVESMDDAVFLIDENRNLALINKKFLELTGLKRDVVINRNIDDIASNSDLLTQILRTISNSKKDVEVELNSLRIVMGKDEYFFKIETDEILTYSAFLKKEIFIGTMVMLKDVTQFQERDAAKTNLLATVSHELKTPLSSINLCLKMLNDERTGKLNAEQKELIVSLRNQSNRLSRVIKELLDFSQIETGNIRLNIGVIEPANILEMSVVALMMSISEKEIEIVTQIDDNLPNVSGDNEKSVFVFVNLLNNAIRYSPKGGAVVLSVRRCDGFVEFSVKDSGPGISQADQEKLFKRFVRLDSKDKSGWGLGLVIAKDFVIAQGGEISVESNPGEGSCFSFTLPVVGS